MSGASLPPVIPEPFANAAPVGNDPGDKTSPIPDTTADPQAASWSAGFPALTMQPIIAGGKPVLGQNVNGVLFAITAHDFFRQAGQMWPFNSAVATAIGGYIVGAQVASTDGVTIWQNLTDGNTTDPDSGGAAGWVGISSYGFLTIPSTGGTVTVANSAAGKPMIIVQGTLTSNLVINLPALQREWLVINNNSGTFTTTVKTAGGTGVIIPQGGFSNPVGVYGDGTNIYPTVPAASLIPASQVQDPLTLAERTNNGSLIAYLFGSTAPVANPTIANVITDSGNGFLQKNSISNFESQLLLQAIGGAVTASQVPPGAVTQYTPAILASAALTGTPTAPTLASGSNGPEVANAAYVNPASSVTMPGFFKLASGHIVQYGTANPGGGSQAISLPVPYSGASNYVAFAISVANSAVQTWISSSGKTAAGFTISNSGGSAFWFTIGF